MSTGGGWIIGYGSLIWRPAFPSEEAVPGVLEGWMRRFWQGSPDHRGTPDSPGRVATVLPRAGARIGVVAYRLPQAAREIRERLDHREKAGYRLETVQVQLADGRPIEGEVYAAGPGNPSWLGPAPVPQMAEHIARSVGPSGPNREYLVELDEALLRLGYADSHVRAIREALPP